MIISKLIMGWDEAIYFDIINYTKKTIIFLSLMLSFVLVRVIETICCIQSTFAARIINNIQKELELSKFDRPNFFITENYQMTVN